MTFAEGAKALGGKDFLGSLAVKILISLLGGAAVAGLLLLFRGPKSIPASCPDGEEFFKITKNNDRFLNAQREDENAGKLRGATRNKPQKV